MDDGELGVEGCGENDILEVMRWIANRPCRLQVWR